MDDSCAPASVGGGTAVVGAGALTIALHSTAELIPKFESVIGDHLVRFGLRDELTVSWTRSNGSPGSVQTK